MPLVPIEEYQKKKEDSGKDQSMLFKALDFINKPQYAVANAIYQAYTDDDAKLGKSLWDGFTLKEKRSVGDTLREIVEPDSKMGKLAVGTAGFVGDILTDPLTYTGVGLVGKSGKLLKSGTEAKRMAKAVRASGDTGQSKRVFTASVPTGIRKNPLKPIKFEEKVIPGSDIIAEPIAKGLGKISGKLKNDLGPISDVLNSVGETVSTKFRPMNIDPIEWQKILRAKDLAKNIRSNIELDTIEKSRQIKKAFRDEGLSDDDIANITNQLETKKTITSTGGKIAKEFSDEMSELYSKTGPSGKSLIDDDNIDYVPHVLETKSKKYQDALGYNKRDFTTSSPSDISRTILKYTDGGEEFILSEKTGKYYQNGKLKGKLTAKELSELDPDSVSQASIADINKGYGDIVFSSSLPKLMAIQGMRTAKVVGGDTFFKEVQKVGKRVPKKGMIESTAPELKGLYFNPEVVKHIDKTYESLKPQAVNDFMSKYDKIQNAWKTSATFWNVAFHTRNGISNVWQNSLAGVDNPADYLRASRIQIGSRKGIDNLSPEDQKTMKEYRSQGLDTTGHFSGDIEESLEAQINSFFDEAKKIKSSSGIYGKAKATGKTALTGMNKASGAVGNAVENNAKIAHFIAKRNEGLSPFEAGRSVKKYLFDYGDLTRVEKDVFKRLAPFYTFSRKNIPLQIETLIKDPSRQSKLIKLKNNVEVYSGEDKTSEILPEYLKQASPVFIGSKDGKVRYIKLEGFLPTADLNRLSNPAQEMINNFTPLLKAPIEQLTNQNFFFGQPLTRQKGVKGFLGYGERDYLFTRIPGRLEHLARLYRPLSEIDKIIGRRSSGQDSFEKFLNLGVGGKIYEYDVNDLLKKFDRLTEEEARGIKYQINQLKREIKKDPKKERVNKRDIKQLMILYKKKRLYAKKQQREAREKLR